MWCPSFEEKNFYPCSQPPLELVIVLMLAQVVCCQGGVCHLAMVLEERFLGHREKPTSLISYWDQLIWSLGAVIWFGWVIYRTSAISARLGVMVVELTQVIYSRSCKSHFLACFGIISLLKWEKLVEVDVLFLLWSVGMCIGPHLGNGACESRLSISTRNRISVLPQGP